MKLKIGDEVQVITGKDKSKKGKILKILSSSNKVVVEKANMITKHIKKTAQRKGERIHLEAPLQVSNVMLICPHCKKTTRVGYKKLETGKKQRICKHCKDSVDTVVVTKRKTSSKQKK